MTRAQVFRCVAAGTIAVTVAACSTPRHDDGPACAASYAAGDGLGAMLVVQALAQAWRAAPVGDLAAAPEPSPSEVAKALTVLRCDQSARGRSRHRRAIGKLVAADWAGARSTPALLALGLPDGAAVGRLKAAILKDVAPPVFTLHGHDPAWLESAALRSLTTSDDAPWDARRARRVPFGAAPAYAQPLPASCWRSEGPSTNDFVDPYVELRAHVSVDRSLVDVERNVDAQKWNDCGSFWSPAGPGNQGPPLDGAVFVTPSWMPCAIPTPPLSPDAGAPAPGTTYNPPHYLFEQFFYRFPTKDTVHFENVLNIWVVPGTHLTPGGTPLPSQRLGFHLGSCGNDQVKGAIGGAIGGAQMKVELDSGYIEMWSEGGRTHVASLKQVQLSDPVSNWLMQFNPALSELNDELGELACCL